MGVILNNLMQFVLSTNPLTIPEAVTAMNCKLHIPLMNAMLRSDETRAAYLDELTEAGADRVYLCPERDLLCRPDRADELALLQTNIDFLRSHGFEVGVWIQAFGFGVPATPSMAPVIDHCTKIRSVAGFTCGDAFCPEDGIYMDYFTRQVREIAALHPDMLLLDDDLCLSVRPGIGCFCDSHLKLLASSFCEPIIGPDGTRFDPETLPDRGDASSLTPIPFAALAGKLFTGGENRYRTAWLSVMGDSLRGFCAAVRAAADAVDPALRVGFCAGYTSFDLEGAGAEELTMILAGQHTQPLLRLSGAPYWAANHTNRFPDQRLHTIIEFCRAQEVWCHARDKDMELFHEGDVYPRPRTIIPASLLECYDGALRASGGIHSFKYMLDYYSAPGYETGYVRRHRRNLPLYTLLDREAAHRPAAGVRVIETQYKLSHMTLPDAFIGESAIMKTAFSPAAAFLTENSLPTTYAAPVEAAGADQTVQTAMTTQTAQTSQTAIAFGVHAREVLPLLGRPAAPRKLILDLPAARLLSEAGVDVGLAAWERLCTDQEVFEQFGDLTDEEYLSGKRRVSLHKSYIGDLFRLTTREGARVLSRFAVGSDTMPAAYTYTSGGTEFLIYAFDGFTVSQSGGVFVSYERQRQLMDFCADFPRVMGCPFLYTLVKRDADATVVFFANINEDDMFDFDILLDRPYASFSLCGAEGGMRGDNIHVESTIPPYGMFALILTH